MLKQLITGVVTGTIQVLLAPLGISIVVHLTITKFAHLGLLWLAVAFSWIFLTAHGAVLARSSARAAEQVAEKLQSLAQQGYKLNLRPSTSFGENALQSLEADLKKQKITDTKLLIVLGNSDSDGALPALMSFPIQINYWILIVDRIPDLRHPRHLIEAHHELGHIAACILSIETREVWLRLGVGYLPIIALSDSLALRISVAVAIILDIFVSSSPYENEIAADSWAYRQFVRDHGWAMAEKAATRLIRVLSQDAHGDEPNAKMAAVRIAFLKLMIARMPRDLISMERSMSGWPRLGHGRIPVPLGVLRIGLGVYAGLRLAPYAHIERIQMIIWGLLGVLLALMAIAISRRNTANAKLERALTRFVGDDSVDAKASSS